MNAADSSAELLRLTLVQTDTVWHDPVANREHITQLLSDLHPGETDLVALPEMFTTGFTMHAATQAESMDGKTIVWMRALAERLQAVVTGTLAIRHDGACFNRLIWMPPDGLPQIYDKRHLFRMAGEAEAYSCGAARPTFSVKGWRVRPIICYDLRFPAWCRNLDLDYDLLLCLANWPSPRHNAWVTLLGARAIENLACVAAVNRVGIDAFDKHYLGSSMVIDAKGIILADAQDEAGIISAALNRGELTAFRSKFPVYLDADHFVLR